MNDTQNTNDKKNSLFNRFLNGVEKAGNKMVDPVTLFVILCAIVVVFSAIASFSGVQAVHPGTGETIKPNNLLSAAGVVRFFKEAVTNFQNFPPFAMVLVALMGVGLAEKTGLLAVTMRKTLADVPSKMVTFIIVLVGIIGNIAGDAAFVVLPPLAALIFAGMGRHPLIGLFAAYASVAGGFAATVAIGLGDVLAYGFTLPAAQMIDPEYLGSPAMNYYFMTASTFVLAIAGTFVTEKIVAPRFSVYNASHMDADGHSDSFNCAITEKELKALDKSGIALLLYVLVIALMSVGPFKILAHPDTGSILTGGSPFMSGIILIVTLMFFIPALVYGFSSGQLKNDRDVINHINSSMAGMSSYILMAFVCAQFAAFFTWSNLGMVIAIKGADFLNFLGLTGPLLMVVFILICAFINLFMGSASAKWAILAPVFVPMFMFMDYSPAVTQMAYRIGDSITNPISPLFTYAAILLGFVKKYDKDAGIGTLIANMIPYSLIFGLVWTVMFGIWIALGIPLGPEGSIFYHIGG